LDVVVNVLLKTMLVLVLEVEGIIFSEELFVNLENAFGNQI
jgi:hypothetical protein